MDNGSRKLYEELGELARFMENAVRKLNEIGGPMLGSSAQLPLAASHLTDLNKMTEDGTLEVMRLTEMIQDNRGRAVAELSAIVDLLEAMDCSKLASRARQIVLGLTQDEKHLSDIMTALSFQDLVAQRVKKLVAILDDVQGRLMELVVVFGLQGAPGRSPTEGKAAEMLKQLEASKSTAMKQQLADEILAQFGFT